MTGRPRPAADPGVAGHLRDVLEVGLAETADGGPVDSDDRLVVTKDRLTGALSCPVHATAGRFGERSYSVPLACGALVDVLFRQIVTTGVVGDPMDDGLAGLATDGRQDELVAWICALAAADLAELRSEVERQAGGLAERWPPLEARWLPRTQESMRVTLAGGRVELATRVDLAVGGPADDEASVALVEVKSGRRRPEHRLDLAFSALIEALRSPAPPFAVATYYSRTGELDVEAVTGRLLVEAARRCVAGTRVLAGLGSDGEIGAWCVACSVMPARVVDTVPTGAGPVVPILVGRAA